MNYDIECPYCNEGQEINHDDGYGYSEFETHEQECGHCEKTFVYTTSISFDYDAAKADCLNGGVHVYEAICTAPIEYTKMECKVCSHRRECTDAEMNEVMDGWENRRRGTHE